MERAVHVAKLKVVPFFCDECKVELSTGHACPECKRVLCHRHYFGSRVGVRRRKDGLCARCAEKLKAEDDKDQQA